MLILKMTANCLLLMLLHYLLILVMLQVLITSIGKKIIWILIKSDCCHTSYLNTAPGLPLEMLTVMGSTIYISEALLCTPVHFYYSNPMVNLLRIHYRK